MILSGRFTPEDCYNFLQQDKATDFIDRQKIVEFGESDQAKIHTIRAGSHWKKDDVFSPRVWSGKPYFSPQIIFAPELIITKTEKLGTTMYGDEVRFWKPYEGTDWAHRPDMKQTLSRSEAESVAQNDGLLVDDFKAWFNFALPYSKKTATLIG